ncbi:unnamed protein product [Cuscuta europaea]|uniref:Uncharacterized protein n=1 Tax=Cuscuta europaea TaxID=41803 RepID=A0A9P1E3E5_CUSEU|nr:unnamed protein product [Cuscuta europaea]
MQDHEAQNIDKCEGAIDGNSVVMSLERNGCPIMCGRGVTKKVIAKAKEAEQSDSMTPNDMNTIMSTLRKEFEEENEKKNAEIEQMRKECEIEKQKMKLVLSKLATLITDLDPASLEL